MGKVPLPILKELEHQARQNISTLNFTAAFAKTSSSCNATLEKCQHSLKSTFKRVKSQIQKGANPEKAVKRGYEQACEYLDLWNKTVLIQHRSLTCLSKSLAHILQRALYTMGNTGLLRREAEMTLLQPHLGEMRTQELALLALFLVQVSTCEGGRRLASQKKAPLKTLRVLHPIKISPFVVSTIRKETPTGNAPVGATPHKAVTNRFPQVWGNRTSESPGAIFNPTLGDEGVETPPPNDSLKASLSPPVGGRLCSFRRDWQTNKCSSNMLNIITNGYVLPFLSKPNLVRFPLIQSEYKAHQKDQALATCIQSLLSKNAIKRVENVKSLGFYSRLFLVPKPYKRWRPVIDLSRLNTFLHTVQNGNSRVHQDLPNSRIMGIVDRPIRRLPSHPRPPKLKKIPKFLPQVAGVPAHLPPFRTSHSHPGLYNDRKGSEANGPLQRTQTSPIPGRLADQVPVSVGSPSEHSGSGRPNPVLGVDNKSGEIRTKTYSGVFIHGL